MTGKFWRLKTEGTKKKKALKHIFYIEIEYLNMKILLKIMKVGWQSKTESKLCPDSRITWSGLGKSTDPLAIETVVLARVLKLRTRWET